MPFIKLSSGTIVFCAEHKLPAEFTLATEEEIIGAGFPPTADAGPAKENRRMTEQLRWEQVTRVSREAKDRATGPAWKH